MGNDFSLKNFTRETKDWGTIIDTGHVPDRVKQRWALRQSSTTQDLITYSSPFGAGLGKIAIVLRHLSEAGKNIYCNVNDESQDVHDAVSTDPDTRLSLLSAAKSSGPSVTV